MAERRPLIDGLKAAAVDPELEAAFVYGSAPPKPKIAQPTAAESATPNANPANSGSARVPFSTRVRTDIANQIKRASLERQLAGQQPSSLTEIVEDALTSWLQGPGRPV